MLSLAHSKRRTWNFVVGPVQNSRREYEIHGTFEKNHDKNYFSDFPEGIEIENHEEYKKTIREEEQAQYDGDSDHVIDDETSFWHIFQL